MARRLAIKGKTCTGMADLDDALGTADEFERRGGCCTRQRQMTVDRAQRIQREQVLDVGQQQFLMLLLVIETERHQGMEFGIDALRQQIVHALVDAGAIGQHFGKGWPGQQSALRARMHRPDRLIIGVEEEQPVLVEEPVAGIAGEHELLEEPGGVGEMPLGRAGLRHRLRHAVLGRQIGNQTQGRRAHLPPGFVNPARAGACSINLLHGDGSTSMGGSIDALAPSPCILHRQVEPAMKMPACAWQTFSRAQ